MHAPAKLGRQIRGQRAPLGVEVDSTGVVRAKWCTVEAIPSIAAASAHEHTAVCDAQSNAARANALEHALCGLVNGMHGRTGPVTTALSIDVVVAVPHHARERTTAAVAAWLAGGTTGCVGVTCARELSGRPVTAVEYFFEIKMKLIIVDAKHKIDSILLMPYTASPFG